MSKQQSEQNNLLIQINKYVKDEDIPEVKRLVCLLVEAQLSGREHEIRNEAYKQGTIDTATSLETQKFINERERLARIDELHMVTKVALSPTGLLNIPELSDKMPSILWVIGDRIKNRLDMLSTNPHTEEEG